MLINKINEVDSFSISENKLIISKNQQCVQFLDHKLNIVSEELVSENIQEINSENKFIWTNTSNDGNGLILQSQKFEIKPFLIKSIDSDGNIYCRLDNKGSKIDKNEKIVWQLEDKFFVFLIAINIFFYRKNKNKIIAIDNYNGNPLWQYELPESYDWQRRTVHINKPYESTKAEIFNILGVYKEKVYLVLNSGRIIGLDAETGKEILTKWLPDDFPVNHDFESQTRTVFGGESTQIDVVNGIVFGMFNSFYGEFDLNNGIYKFFDISETLQKNAIRYTDWGAWQGDEIIFGETDFADRPAHVGIFNRQTRQITWTSQELGEEGTFKGIQKIEYQGNRLYVLDRASTLHIFERE